MKIDNFIYLSTILAWITFSYITSKDKEKKIIYIILSLFVVLGIFDIRLASQTNTIETEVVLVYLVPLLFSISVVIKLVSRKKL